MIEAKRKYRAYSDIHWGPHYNPEDKAHHCIAYGPDEAAEVLRTVRRKGDGFGSLQVFAGGEWRWVTETPPILGGISNK